MSRRFAGTLATFINLVVQQHVRGVCCEGPAGADLYESSVALMQAVKDDICMKQARTQACTLRESVALEHAPCQYFDSTSKSPGAAAHQQTCQACNFKSLSTGDNKFLSGGRMRLELESHLWLCTAHNFTLNSSETYHEGLDCPPTSCFCCA